MSTHSRSRLNPSQAKEQLIRLKTRTGIPQWNILCRWAFCLSLAEPTPPTPIEIPGPQQCRDELARVRR